MNLSTLALVFLQVILATCAIIMSLWAKLPWVTVLALGVLGLSAILGQVTSPPLERFRRSATVIAWICTLLVPASLFFTADEALDFEIYLDKYFATLAWLVAASILPATSRLVQDGSMNRWKLPVITWAFCGAVLWMLTAYYRNEDGAFFIGLLITVALLVFCHLWFRLSFLGIQMVNTLLLLLIGLPVADVLFHPAYHLRKAPDLRRQLYSYDATARDASDFAHWWNYYLQQWKETERDILLPPDDHFLPYRLRPGSQGVLMQSQIAINTLGFRGKNIAQPKGDTYRIVALGGSTTFGITLDAGDRPWPELLEGLIRRKFTHERPVEVINAGVPGYTLAHNLHRFARDILPLNPDMVICYHGINGFPLLDERLPSMLGAPPPPYRDRPVHLLADCEYRLKLFGYERQRMAEVANPPQGLPDLMESAYAQQYRDLIALALSNNIRLVLATFSMAVNEKSDPGAVRFYEVGYRQAPRLIKANVLHTSILQSLSKEHPEICLVDTQPGLDGQHTNFIDLVHFSHNGDLKMAETLCRGIQQVLEQELTRSAPVAQVQP